MDRAKIQRVSVKQLQDVIEYRSPCGRFLAKEGRTWVAVDNSTGDAWTEDFARKSQAVQWLRGEIEVETGTYYIDDVYGIQQEAVNA